MVRICVALLMEKFVVKSGELLWVCDLRLGLVPEAIDIISHVLVIQPPFYALFSVPRADASLQSGSGV